MKTSTGKPNKEEQARFDRMKEMALCLACDQRGLIAGFIEIHHLLSGGKRRGHMFTVSLCQWHHRAVPKSELGYHTKKATREIYGDSLADGSKPFHAMFGSDADLLAKQNEILGDK